MKEDMIYKKRNFLLPLLLFLLLFPGCHREEVAKPKPIELDRRHICRVCGMIIVDFPGPKAQIHYRNGRIDTFCSVLEMMTFYLQPDRPHGIVAIYVNDMSKADWKHPVNHWLDAEKSLYVHGSDMSGPMGEEIIPFPDVPSAEEFTRSHGGRITRFNEITMDMLRPK
jgi:copper chaperone NosL